MKNFITKLVLILIISGAAAGAVSAQRNYVRVRPRHVVVARPPMTRPGYVWIAPEWTWRGGAYVEVPGYWAPPQSGRMWIQGYWRNTPRRGYEWVPGRWGHRGRGRGRY
ncbi:MAG: hypothetical protein LBE82_11890 [Chitinophagaceae bacterium]|jgi:hypothetical protein|nr:hypothetical protein [Chitinophagaceae bacterium]